MAVERVDYGTEDEFQQALIEEQQEAEQAEIRGQAEQYEAEKAQADWQAQQDADAQAQFEAEQAPQGEEGE